MLAGAIHALTASSETTLEALVILNRSGVPRALRADNSHADAVHTRQRPSLNRDRKEAVVDAPPQSGPLICGYGRAGSGPAGNSLDGRKYEYFVDGQRPDLWKLPPGRYLVKVTVRGSGEVAHGVLVLLNWPNQQPSLIHPTRAERALLLKAQ
jgi:hypothetical protein